MAFVIISPAFDANVPESRGAVESAVEADRFVLAREHASTVRGRKGDYRVAVVKYHRIRADRAVGECLRVIKLQNAVRVNNALVVAIVAAERAPKE